MAGKSKGMRPERNLLLGKRLRLTREAMRFSQKDFAQKAGVNEISYNQWENGAVYPPVDSAIKLCKAHHLTLDWIYQADPACLPAWLDTAIKALGTAEASREAHKRVRMTIVQPRRRSSAA
jgi:transcriptional regulator with XRE-family HTH domain